MSLQTRLMTAVIGFVSLILIIVAVITSATLGSTLEQQLDDLRRAFRHIGEGGVPDTGGRTAVMDQLPHVFATGAHPFEPGLDHQPQGIASREPGIHLGAAPNRAGQSEQAVHLCLTFRLTSHVVPRALTVSLTARQLP